MDFGKDSFAFSPFYCPFGRTRDSSISTKEHELIGHNVSAGAQHDSEHKQKAVYNETDVRQFSQFLVMDRGQYGRPCEKSKIVEIPNETLEVEHIAERKVQQGPH